jgi:hypothetical protein
MRKTGCLMAGEQSRGGSFHSVPLTDTSAFRDRDVGDLAVRYREAEPGPHIALDGLFPDEVLQAICDEIDAIEIDPEKNFYSTYLKRRISDLSRLPPTARRLIEDLNSADFLGFLERLTGIEGLIPDPYLEGGGIHQIGTGGFLKIHTDFNFHSRLRLHRRINLLLYLNPGWQPQWGGALELWDADVTECKASYLPEFNRMVLFSTTDQSYHGHPDPLTCPDNIRRNSIALYYYTAERPQDEVRFSKSTMTNYQPRPSEKFAKGRLHHLINQMEIRFPFVRRIMKIGRKLK